MTIPVPRKKIDSGKGRKAVTCTLEEEIGRHDSTFQIVIIIVGGKHYI